MTANGQSYLPSRKKGHLKFLFFGLAGTALARACANIIRPRLLKIAAVVIVSVRRVKLAMSEDCPNQREFLVAFHNLSAAAR